VRFSRHAKNKARDLKVSVADAEAMVARATVVDRDVDGRPRYTGYIGGVPVRVIVALDDPELIVTIYERRRL
jgi:hypothetical protein